MRLLSRFSVWVYWVSYAVITSFVPRASSTEGAIVAIGLCFAFVCAVGVAHGQVEEKHTASLPLEQGLEKIREEFKLPALAAASIHGSQILESAAVGLRRVGGTQKVTLEDQWHLGSCTKSMTASLAAMLVERGKIDWTSTVGAAFPELRKTMSPQWANVTLEQLLTHRAGAPGNAPPDLWAEASKQKGTVAQQRNAFVKGLLERPPELPPGTKYLYSNQGYTIAGVMLERADGRTWEEQMRTQLFPAAGLRHAGFGVAATPGREDQPWAHSRIKGELKPVPPGPAADNPPAIGPAGIVFCTIEDLARYAEWHARGETEGAAPLKRESFIRLHTPPEGGDYAMGWLVALRPWAGGKALTHSGSNTMFYAVIWIAPAKDAAFVAATNCPGDEAQKACDQAISLLISRFAKSSP